MNKSQSEFCDGLRESPDNDWTNASPEERIEAVWTLTTLCLAWNKTSASEPQTSKNWLLAFNAHRDEYLIVGPHALAAHEACPCDERHGCLGAA